MSMRGKKYSRRFVSSSVSDTISRSVAATARTLRNPVRGKMGYGMGLIIITARMTMRKRSISVQGRLPIAP